MRHRSSSRDKDARPLRIRSRFAARQAEVRPNGSAWCVSVTALSPRFAALPAGKLTILVRNHTLRARQVADGLKSRKEHSRGV